MVDYVSLASTAQNLLTSFGQTLAFSRITGGTFDPILGGSSGTSVTNYTSKGVVLDFEAKKIDGIHVLRSDKRLILDSTTTPLNDDTVTANGVVYTIVTVTELNPGGTVVIYDIQIRR